MKIFTQKQIEQLIIGVFAMRLFSVIAFAYPALKATTFERLTGVLFVVIFGIIVLKKMINKEDFKFHWLALFLGYLLFTTILHHGFKTTITDKSYQYPLQLFSLFLVMTEIKSRESFLLILKLFVLLGVIEACVGISQCFLGYPVYHHLITAGEDGYNSDRNYFAFLIPGLSKNTVLASGSFLHFNEFGLFSVINLGIAYSLLLHYRKPIWRVAMIIIFVGIVCSFSRGSLLSSFLCIGFIYFNVTKNGFQKFVITMVVVGTLYVSSKTILAAYMEETQNADVRQDTWIFAYNHCIKHPVNLVFGYGLSYLKVKVLVQETIIYRLQDSLIMSNIHSSHLQIFLEQGIVGSGLLYSTLLFTLYRLFRTRNTFGICLAGLSLGYLFGELFEHFLISQNGFWYFALFGLISSYVLRQEKEPDKEEEQDNIKKTQNLEFA